MCRVVQNIPAKFRESSSKCSAAHPKITLWHNISATYSTKPGRKVFIEVPYIFQEFKLKTKCLVHRGTVGLFMLCSLLVTCLEWVGNGSKITCVMEGHPDNWKIPQNVINTGWRRTLTS